MCLILPPWSFEDNKVLKSQLDMLIFVQVCRTIDKNLHSNIGSERTNENSDIFRRKLVLQDWRQRESEDPSEADCQKLTSSESLKIIRSWSSTKSDWKLELVKSCYYENKSLQKEYTPRATANLEIFEGIGCLSFEECRKGQ